MTEIVPITGKTKYRINLDPGVWIFDKRKIDLNRYVTNGKMVTVEEREADGSYAIPFEPFLEHAEPLPEASLVICHLEDGRAVTLDLAEGRRAVLAFALEGKPIREGGPLHIYFGVPHHQRPPLTHVVRFEVV